MKPARRPRVVLFDAGNTLVFLDHEAVAAALAGQGIVTTAAALARGEREAVELYEKRLAQNATHSWGQHVLAILCAAGVEEAKAREVLGALRAVHDEFNLWRRVPDGLPAALGRLRGAGVRVAVVSNSEGKLDVLFERVGLREHLELIVDSAIEGISKPNPEIFERALGRLDIAPSDALYAGDLPSVDVKGARSAGLYAALIDPNDVHRELEDVWRTRSTVQLITEVLALPV